MSPATRKLTGRASDTRNLPGNAPYSINARLTERQREHLAAIAEAQGTRGVSAAVRTVIDRDIEREEGPVLSNEPMDIPELTRPVAWDLEHDPEFPDQVHLVIEFENDDEPGSGHRMVLPMERHQAHSLLAHLGEKLAEADEAAS